MGNPADLLCSIVFATFVEKTCAEDCSVIGSMHCSFVFLNSLYTLFAYRCFHSYLIQFLGLFYHNLSIKSIFFSAKPKLKQAQTAPALTSCT